MATRALSRQGMLPTRTSILSGVTAHQACNRAWPWPSYHGMRVIHIYDNQPYLVPNMFFGVKIRAIGRPLHDLNLNPTRKLRVFRAVWVCHCHVQAQKKSLGSFPTPGKEILAQYASVALLIDHAIYHHPLRFAWCIESTPYHEERVSTFPFVS